MLYHSLALPQDAIEIVRRFRLDAFDWEGDGTAQGFADFIFFRGGVANLSRLTDLMHEYQLRCIDEGTDAVDSFYSRERAEMVKSLLRVDGGWRVLAAYVRKVKFGEMGFVWNHVAKLATLGSDDRSDYLVTLAAPWVAEISTVLGGFQQVFEPMRRSRNHDYVPGLSSFEDHCVHSGILDLDKHLEGMPPWDGQEEPPVLVECDAVADLARDRVFWDGVKANLAWSRFRAELEHRPMESP